MEVSDLDILLRGSYIWRRQIYYNIPYKSWDWKAMLMNMYYVYFYFLCSSHAGKGCVMVNCLAAALEFGKFQFDTTSGNQFWIFMTIERTGSNELVHLHAITRTYPVVMLVDPL